MTLVATYHVNTCYKILPKVSKVTIFSYSVHPHKHSPQQVNNTKSTVAETDVFQVFIAISYCDIIM